MVQRFVHAGLILIALALITFPVTVTAQNGPGDIIIQAAKFAVDAVAISHDGLLIAAATCDEMTDAGTCPQAQIRFWDMKGKQVGTPINAARDFIIAMQFSPDGKLLVSGGSDFFIRIWDVKTRKQVGKSLNQNGYVFDVAFSPDGKKVTATTGYNTDKVHSWVVATGAKADISFATTFTAITKLAYSPDGGVLAIASCADFDKTNFRCNKGQINLVDPKAGHPVHDALISDAATGISALAFSPDGKLLAAGDRQGKIFLWDATTYQPISASLFAHIGEVHSLSFTADSQQLASAGEDGLVKTWDMSPPIDTTTLNGTPYAGHKGLALSVAFNSKDNGLVSGGSDGKLIIWKVNQ